MNRSSFGTAAARENVRSTRPSLRAYSARKWYSGDTLQSNIHNNDIFSGSIYLHCTLPPLDEWIEQLHWNVELKRVGEKYCQRHHDLYQDCKAEKQGEHELCAK